MHEGNDVVEYKVKDNSSIVKKFPINHKEKNKSKQNKEKPIVV